MSLIDDVTRKILEETYTGICNVYAKQKQKDEITKQTSTTEVLVNENLPCGLSYSGSSPTSKEEGADRNNQQIKLFLSPDKSIPSGSKIVVTQNGVTQAYSMSSVPSVYTTHQEIALEIFTRWA